jgi:hypothetical protein
VQKLRGIHCAFSNRTLSVTAAVCLKSSVHGSALRLLLLFV